MSTIVRCAAIAIVLRASGAALADDNSMSPLTGESYAYFYRLDYVPGGFNVAAAHESQPVGEASVQPATAQPHAEPPVMLAGKAHTASPGGLPPVFNDATGA
jgi:hypothetical protein